MVAVVTAVRPSLSLPPLMNSCMAVVRGEREKRASRWRGKKCDQETGPEWAEGES